MTTDGVFLCIFKIHVYFQDTYFQDVISTKKYIFSRCNLYKEIYIFSAKVILPKKKHKK